MIIFVCSVFYTTEQKWKFLFLAHQDKTTESSYVCVHILICVITVRWQHYWQSLSIHEHIRDYKNWAPKHTYEVRFSSLVSLTAWRGFFICGSSLRLTFFLEHGAHLDHHSLCQFHRWYSFSQLAIVIVFGCLWFLFFVLVWGFFVLFCFFGVSPTHCFCRWPKNNRKKDSLGSCLPSSECVQSGALGTRQAVATSAFLCSSWAKDGHSQWELLHHPLWEQLGVLMGTYES